MSDLRLVRKYFYGVIDCSREGALGITGIDDRAVCCTPWHDIGAAVSEFPRDRCSANVSAIARHELVIETLMKTHSLLPARFGTILSEAAQVTELLSANYEGFLRDLERLRNKVEFGLKVLWPAGELRMLIERNEPGLSPPGNCPAGPGARYALFKRRESAIELALAHRAEGNVTEIQRALLQFSSESRCQVLPSEGLMLSGVYLVDRSQCEAFRKVVDALQSKSSKFCFLLAGPWPPHSFMSLDSRIMKYQTC